MNASGHLFVGVDALGWYYSSILKLSLSYYWTKSQSQNCFWLALWSKHVTIIACLLRGVCSMTTNVAQCHVTFLNEWLPNLKGTRVGSVIDNNLTDYLICGSHPSAAAFTNACVGRWYTVLCSWWLMAVYHCSAANVEDVLSINWREWGWCLFSLCLLLR